MTTTAPSISATVGAGGTNTPDDVRVVQDLLNRAADAGLAVDGVCGPDTRQAITAYQAAFLRTPDGRVDPGGQTLRRLAAEARDRRGPPRSDPATAAGPADGLRLTQFASQGNGHYAYSFPERQYGTDTMLQLLTSTAATLHQGGLEFGVGDISFQQGGQMPPHTTHRAGRHVDLRPLRTDNARGPVSLGDSRYSREGTRTLVEALLAQGSVRRILFNDAEIAGVRHFAGHDNHLHVELGQ
ncbi:peptidoglycan-binding protein [Streptomyces sp. NPDC056486]|uniref:peptidoglycan-binding domain-containing protein n=1 Tax=Streptomyces sp. NPDC056486 TaxID=3345835 RepID=UPI0036D1F958